MKSDLPAVSQPTLTDECMHHWVLRSYEDAAGTTPATCKTCGITREFTSTPPRLALASTRRQAPRVAAPGN